MNETCANCGQPITKINYALGEEWMHITLGASIPTTRKDTAWKYCKTSVATPKPRVKA